jgi:hypothetical protein
MIEKTFNNFDTNSDEGKMLLAALSILTSIRCDDIKKGIYGGSISPDNALTKIQDLANKIYYEREWEIKEVRKQRNEKITKIEND